MTKILQVDERSGLLSDSPGFQGFLQRFPTAGVVDTGDFCQFILMHRGLVWPQLLGQRLVGSHDPAVGTIGVTMFICIDPC